MTDAGNPEDDVGHKLRDARPAQSDAVAASLRASLERAMFGAEPENVTLGRFVLLSRVGGGAMGTVFSAFDPRLDRKVAVKILRAPAADARRRVLREARALGQLTHPNVVAVHDADEVQDWVYIAMELVEGQDLAAWMSDGGRRWPDTLRVLIDAGKGLAAAHHAGIVHSDFKPANVLVGADRVRVADFGMARREQDPATVRGGFDDLMALAETASPETQGVGGTPYYMAPEVIEGASPNARSDQYSFCVTAYEALAGVRPFSGKNLEQLRDAMRDTAPSGKIDAPAWLSRAILRGLSPDPEDRFESMDALIDEMSRDRIRRVRGIAVVAGVCAAVGLGALVARSAGGKREPCAGGEDAIESVWSETERSALRTAFSSVEVPYAAPAAQRAIRSLDEHAGAWVASHRRICRATRVEKVQSDTLYDARMQCLDRRRTALGALGQAVSRVSSAREIERAVTAAAGLDSPTDCETIEVGPGSALPKSPQQRERVIALLAEIDRAWSDYQLGRYDDALAAAKRLHDDATELDASAAAEAALLLGTAQARTDSAERATATLFDALEQTARAGGDALAVRIWSRLLRNELSRGNYDQVLEWGEFARLASLRARVPSPDIDAAVGEALMAQGKLDTARARLASALTQLRSQSSPRKDREAIILANLGTAELRGGDVVSAQQRFRDALAVFENAYGADHPGVALYLDRVGRGLLAAGEPASALAQHDRALAIREVAYGAQDRAVASSLSDRASALQDLGRLDEATADLQRALRIRQQAYGSDHPRTADVLKKLGDIAAKRNDPKAARALWHRALEVRRARTPEHPDVEVLEQALRAAP